MFKIINVDNFITQNRLKGPVTTAEIFSGKSRQFNPFGLFSEEIFGVDGSSSRSHTYSWVELNCPVIQPVIYNLLRKRIERKIDPLLSGDKTFSLDKNDNLVEDPDGTISGISSFYDNITKIRFRSDTNTPSNMRNKIIKVFEKAITTKSFFTTKLIIISPASRPIMLPDDEEESLHDVSMDDINEIYQKIINTAHRLKGVSGTLYDILAYKMQLLIFQLYEYIKSKIAKKTGVLRNLILGRRVDFCARGVIGPDPNLPAFTIGVPLKAVCNVFQPFLIYALCSDKSIFAKTIPDKFYIELEKYMNKE